MKRFFSLLLIFGILISCITVRAEDNFAVMLYSDRPIITVNDVDYEISGVPYVINYNTYVPADDVLRYCGFSMGWDSEICATVADNGINRAYYFMNKDYILINGERKDFNVKTKYIDGYVYMPFVMLAEITDAAVYIQGDLQWFPKRDMLEDTVITDEYRLSGNSVATYKGITIVDNIGMELLVVTQDLAKSYANVVNQVANALPDVNVYCIAVPTACEFYAPRRLYTNQTAGIKTLYESLNANVTPVNVVKPLMEHAGEKIYYSTDHHWTQRGAYYGYRAFAQTKGDVVDPLGSFESNNYWSHVGSFANFTSGTAGQWIMRSNPELLERFIPKYNSDGAVYGSMYMSNKLCSIKAVDTNATTYQAFMGGDNPLAVFKTENHNGKKLVVIKESYGTAFASWAVNDYEEIYIIDPRHMSDMNLKTFYQMVHFDDLVIINYPGGIASSTIKQGLRNFVN